MASVNGIQGQLLEVTVIGCTRLKNTEWISRQDPYVCLEYASTKLRTRTCTDGGKNPTFQEKFIFSLIEGLREIEIHVWNSNTLSMDDFIGSGRIQLHRVLSQGFDDSSWTILSRSGKYAGEVKLIMHFSNSQKQQKQGAGGPQPAPVFMPAAPTAPYGQSYTAPTSLAASPYPCTTCYTTFPPTNPSLYPGSVYPPPPVQQAYPPQPYPPIAYPPPPGMQAMCPPPQQVHPCYPPGPYGGVYPPPN